VSGATQVGTTYKVTWVDVPDRLATTTSVRKQFATGEVTGGASASPRMASPTYPLARNDVSGSEFAGPTFTEDGEVLFACIQGDGYTFAITRGSDRRGGLTGDLIREHPILSLTRKSPRSETGWPNCARRPL
jgi:secreted PhoX family phosphatase